MTNRTRYVLRCMVGTAIICAYVASLFELTKAAEGPPDAFYWILSGANILLLALVVGAPSFLPPKFPPVTNGEQKIRPSDS